MNFADPRSNLQQLGLREGMKVADLGTGMGQYAIAAAHAVGGDGRVYAIDVHEDILTNVADSARSAELRNVETVWADIDRMGGTKLRDASMDAAILSNVLFQVEEPQTVLKEVCRILKSEGRILVIDWAGSYGGIGPHPDDVVPEHSAEALLIDAGFYKAKSFRAGAYHYAIVCIAPTRG